MTRFLSELDLNRVKEGLRATPAPYLHDLGQIKFLSDGFSSFVVLVGEELILRIARHAKATDGHSQERALLPQLQRYLPVQIPQPIWHVEPSDHFPFGATGYRRIPGVPFSLDLARHVDLARIAGDLARFLVALHHVPIDEMMALGVQATDDLSSLQAEVMPILRPHLGQEEFGILRASWERLLDDQAKTRSTPRLIHGDLWCENVILDESLSHVVGIVDFEALRIGDVAQDFAAQRYLGPDFLSLLVRQYQESGGELEEEFAIRLTDQSLIRELRGLGYALRYPESGELPDSLQKVRHELSLSS